MRSLRERSVSDSVADMTCSIELPPLRSFNFRFRERLQRAEGDRCCRHAKQNAPAFLAGALCWMGA